MWDWIPIAVILGLGAVFAWISRERLTEYLRRRTCQGRSWRRAFPEAPRDEIRRFLTLISVAFALSRTERLKLNPGDSVMEIYRLLYPQPGLPDCFELETLAWVLEQEYGLDLEPVWHDGFSLGAIFTLARGSSPA